MHAPPEEAPEVSVPAIDVAAQFGDLPPWVPEPVKPYVPLIINVAAGIAILLLGVIIARWADSFLLKQLRKRSVDEALARFLSSLLRWAVLLMAIIAALGTVGVETTSFVALLASAGLAVGLAMQGSLSHFAAGVMLLIFRPFVIEDFVDIAGKTGTVKEIGLFATRLLTPGGETVIMPNSAITSDTIINYTTEGRRRGAIDIGVAYGSDIAKVLPVLKAAAKKCELVHEDPDVNVHFVEFGASSLNFKVYPWCDTPDYLSMLHEVKVNIYDDLEAAGIEIPFDQIVLHQAPAADASAAE